MGWLKKSFLSIIFVIVLVSLLLMNIFLTFALSLRWSAIHEPLQDFIHGIVIEKITQQQIDAIYPFVLSSCEENEFYNYQEISSGVSLQLPCADIKNAGKSGFVALAEERLIHDFYKKDYSCSLTSCFSSSDKKDLAFYLSREAQMSFMVLFLFSLFFALLLVGLAFLLVDYHSSIFGFIGFALLLSSLPFFNFVIILDVLTAMLLPFSASDTPALIQAFSFVSGNAKIVFLINFFISVVLIALWIFFWLRRRD